MEAVSITIPASPEYLKVLRLVAAGLAARLGFTLDEIEDLKIAVDELTAYLMGPQGREGKLEIRFAVGENELRISGRGHFPHEHRLPTQLTHMSRMILQTVVDAATLEQMDGTPGFSLVKRK